MLNPRVLPLRVLPATPTSSQLSIAALLSLARTIGQAFTAISGRAVTRDLAVNGAAVSIQDSAYLANAITFSTKLGDGVSFTLGELAIFHKDSFLAGLEFLLVCQLITFFQTGVALTMAIREA